MDWTAAGVIVSGALALVAIVVQQRNRRTDRAQVDRAEAIARRAVEAQELMAQAVRMPQVRWRLVHRHGDTYFVENVGDATAHEVHVDIGDLAGPVEDAPARARVEPNEGVRFRAQRTDRTREGVVTVTWVKVPGAADRERWSKKPPPPPPPRRVRTTL